MSVFPDTVIYTSRSLGEREFEVRTQAGRVRFFHAILSSPKLPRVFL